MTLKKTEMTTQLTLCLGNRDNMVTSYGLTWLNWALNDAASVRNWKEMKKFDESLFTVQGRLYNPMPTDNKDIIWLWYKDGAMSKRLTYIHPDTFATMYPHPEGDGLGVPSEYTIEGNFLKLRPVPDESDKQLLMFCVKWPKDFNANEDPPCPLDKLDYAITAQAVSYGAAAMKDFDKVTYYRQEFYRKIRQMARLDGQPSDWTFQYASDRLRNQNYIDELKLYPQTAGTNVY